MLVFPMTSWTVACILPPGVANSFWNSIITRAVLDRGVEIPDGLVIGEDPELDAKRFRRTANGICLVTKPMIDRLTY